MPPDPTPEENLQQIIGSSSYVLPELDSAFLQTDDLRGIRLMLEFHKPELHLKRAGVTSTVIVFGGTQIIPRKLAETDLGLAQKELAAEPDNPQWQRRVQRAESRLAKAHYYDEACEFSRLVSSSCQIDGRCDYVVVTGGGPGIMEAGNRGAFEAGAKSIGLNITLPEEQHPNPYITPDLCFMFRYFAMRKMHFLLRAKALVVFPGGFGTLDELFDALTLRQTNRMQVIPIILYGSEYWNRVIDFQFLADEGVIRDEHLELFQFADSPEEAWNIIAKYHGHPVSDF